MATLVRTSSANDSNHLLRLDIRSAGNRRECGDFVDDELVELLGRGRLGIEPDRRPALRNSGALKMRMISPFSLATIARGVCREVSSPNHNLD